MADRLRWRRVDGMMVLNKETFIITAVDAEKAQGGTVPRAGLYMPRDIDG